MPCDPLRDLRAWQERLERIASQQASPWAPPIDVYETDDRYVITAEVPGLSRDQIDLAVEARADPGTPRATQPAPAAGMAGMPDLSSVAGRAIPSVMNISSLQVVRQQSPFTSDPLFRYFFGDRDDLYGGRNRVSQSLG